ncbi:MAG TPA: nitroreductase family protein [Chthoniobacterales bacterium]|nr:nitroreductase family protein [Chthoniobacterales bacterium]
MQSRTYPMPDDEKALQDALAARFGERLSVDEKLSGLAELAGIAARRTHRRYSPRPVTPELVRLLCACALSAPSKSDLQQSDILVVNDRAIRDVIAAKLPDNPWVGTAPVFLVFLANGQRLPFISDLRGKPFPNDHLDLFFNAVSNCSIVLATFIRAAEAVGLGTCPISAIRDHAAAVSELLRLPRRVIPVAGLCVGWPSERGHISPRLGLDATVHYDRYSERDPAPDIEAYDRRRNEGRPPWKQRNVDRFGEAEFYGWSEDKARQYSEPLRADFGAFVRKKGFRLE